MDVSGQVNVPAAYLQEITLVSIKYETVWSPESVRKIWKREKYFAPAGIWTTDLPTRYVVAVAGLFVMKSYLFNFCPTSSHVGMQ